jgi:uncharacterized RDD family membrane protein YckC
MDDQLVVSTPEQVAFGYEVAGIGSRFLAALVDLTIIIVLYLLIQVLALTTRLVGEVTTEAGTSISSTFAFFLTILAFLVLWGYYVLFETVWQGQTPGKRLAGLRVLRENGGPVGFWDALIRNLVRLLDFLPLAYGIGVATMFANSRARRLGDYAAGTVVVREGAPVRLRDLAARGAVTMIAPAADHPLAAYMDVRRLAATDLGLIRETLARLPTLPPAHAGPLLWQLVTLVCARTGFAGQVHDPAAFLRAVLAAAGGTPPDRV